MGIVKDLYKGAKEITKKAGETIDAAKLNISITDEKRKIENLKKSLGDVVYDKYKLGLCTNDSAVVICRKIDEANNAIAEFQKQIEKMKK